MAPSPAASLPVRPIDQESARTLIKTQMAANLKHFRKVKEQRSGEPHVRSDYDDIWERLQRHLPRALDPLGPDSRGPVGVEFVYVEAPYHPCTLCLAELKPALLSELRLSSHHRGRVLLGKLIAVVDVTWKNTFAAIEDVSGDVEFLDLHFVCMNEKGAHSSPKLRSWLAIKEPFLTLEEIFVTECIRVDHPSDLVYAGSWLTSLLEQIDLPSALIDEGKRTPMEWKQSGNSALAAKKLDAAHYSYT